MSALGILQMLPYSAKRKLSITTNARTVAADDNQGGAAASGHGAAASGPGAEQENAAASGHGAAARTYRFRTQDRRRVIDKRASKLKRMRAFKQIRAQALQHNRRGNARTPDHLLMARGERSFFAPLTRSCGKQGATWKTHTPEAICKAVFTDSHVSLAKRAGISGGTRTYARKCVLMVANILDSASQKKRSDLKRPLALSQSAAVPSGFVVGDGDLRDDFQINNNMFDESQLWIRNIDGGKNGGSNKKRLYRVLATGTQVTRKALGGPIQDTDVWRTPATMQEYTASSCAGVLAQAHDSAGLIPSGDATPKAKYFASLTATDSHAVNKLCSKWISMRHEQEDLRGNEQPERYHVASYCTQHKTGNVVQQVSDYLGIIRPGFALASCLATGHIAGKLDFDLRVVLEMELEIVDPATTELDYPADQSFLRGLFEHCYIRAIPHAVDAEAQENKRRA